MNSIKEMIDDLKRRERTKFLPAFDDTQVFIAIEAKYETKIPPEIIELYDIVGGGFYQVSEGDSWRLLTPHEIQNAPENLHVDFVDLRLIPIVDCKSNDFLCYNIKSEHYVLINVVDLVPFEQFESLASFFVQNSGFDLK